ncbi:MAG: hypothetical protein HRU33_05395 [Rhodobacteraceae bacterium]|nr:hypothetical protein [Paracoccaceae bacterium]
MSPADGETFGKVIRSINGQDYAIANLRARRSFLYMPQLIEPGAGPRALGWLMGEG